MDKLFAGLSLFVGVVTFIKMWNKGLKVEAVWMIVTVIAYNLSIFH